MWNCEVLDCCEDEAAGLLHIAPCERTAVVKIRFGTPYNNGMFWMRMCAKHYETRSERKDRRVLEVTTL